MRVQSYLAVMAVMLRGRQVVAEKVGRKGNNNFMRQGHTISVYGNDPAVKQINRNAEPKEIKAG